MLNRSVVTLVADSIDAAAKARKQVSHGVESSSVRRRMNFALA